MGGRRVTRQADRRIGNLATHESPWVTVAVLAEYLEVDPRTVVRMIGNRTLFAHKVGREWHIPTDAARESFPMKQHQRAS